MTNKNIEVVKELNDFLKGLTMGYDTFKSYIDKAKKTDLKTELQNILSLFSSQKNVIVNYIEKLNGNVKDSLGLRGEIAVMFEKLKDLFMNTDEEILNNSIKALEMGVIGSENVISSLNKINADQTIIHSIDIMLNEYKNIIAHLNKDKE